MRRGTENTASALDVSIHREKLSSDACTNGALPACLSHILVIAYGNSLRRDDGAGLLLAARLVETWRAAGVLVQHVAVQQLVPELGQTIAAEDVAVVVFVDADMRAGERAIRIRPIEAQLATPSLGHHLEPAALLLYARHLYDRQPAAWLVTVPGVDFSLGEGLSPAVQRMLDAAAPLGRALLRRMAACVETSYSLGISEATSPSAYSTSRASSP